MTAPSVSGVATTPLDPREKALRKSARDLEGMFTQQLFKSMRDSVATDGAVVEKSQGEEIFSGLMDEHVAADTGTRWHRGLGDAIYRALRQKAGLGPVPNPAAAIPEAPIASPVRIP